MLKLLVTITLDALEQSCKGELLLVAKLGFLFLDNCLHLCLELVPLELLEQIGLHFDLLSLLVPLHTDKLGLLVSELEQVL